MARRYAQMHQDARQVEQWCIGLKESYAEEVWDAWDQHGLAAAERVATRLKQEQRIAEMQARNDAFWAGLSAHIQKTGGNQW